MHTQRERERERVIRWCVLFAMTMTTTTYTNTKKKDNAVALIFSHIQCVTHERDSTHSKESIYIPQLSCDRARRTPLTA